MTFLALDLYLESRDETLLFAFLKKLFTLESLDFFFTAGFEYDFFEYDFVETFGFGLEYVFLVVILFFTLEKVFFALLETLFAVLLTFFAILERRDFKLLLFFVLLERDLERLLE
ncbi:hypothetical protein K9M74_02655 [Candidatus Woesearchaeota archaeon]|nr:hypothetical protein [Candidatus Woesearchaeota archaeon]